MRTTIYLTVAIAVLFVGSSDAASLNKRTSNNAIASAKGSLNSVTGLAGAVSSNGQQRQKEKRDPFIGDVLDSFYGRDPPSPPTGVNGPQPVAGSSDNPYGSVDGGYHQPGPVVIGPDYVYPGN